MTVIPARLLLALLLLSAAIPARRAPAQTLTLAQALDRANRDAFAVRAARANATAQGAPATAALRGILPSVRVDAGLVRTTDPIGAFGNTLRQRTITQTDFDPRRLNYPSVSENWTGALVIEQPLFNADAIAGRRAGQHIGHAGSRAAEWTTIETRVDVIRAYYGATLATLKVNTLQAANRAADAHVRQAQQLVKNGLATPSDALLASVKAGEVESALLEAQGEVATAKAALATVLGAPDDSAFDLAGGLPATADIRRVAEFSVALAPQLRADVASARDMSAAANDDAWRARSLYLPRLNSFARYDWNAPANLFGGEKNWTVGIVASWSPFAGAAEIAERQATSGRVSAANAMHDGAVARAQLEVKQSAAVLQAALARLQIAERAVGQSGDAHRIVARKYDGGLAGVVELLDAAALETQMRLGLDGARYAVLVATAQRLKALGRDPGMLSHLDDATRVADGNTPQ